MAKIQNLLRDWWGREVHLLQRTAGWAKHFIRGHIEEAVLSAEKGAKGQVDEWVDTAHVVWSEVTGLNGCGELGCDNGNVEPVI